MQIRKLFKVIIGTYRKQSKLYKSQSKYYGLSHNDKTELDTYYIYT